MIQVKNVHKFYGTGGNRNEVLKGVSLQVEDGEFIVILGASGGLLPEFHAHFHIGLFLALSILPSAFFALFSVCCSFHKMRVSALELLRGKELTKVKKAQKNSDRPFLQELRKGTVRQKKSLVFFITFAVFCFSSMMQMSLGMDALADPMMSVMTMGIGLTLSCVILFIAVTSIVRSNAKTVIMMKVFGYSCRDCARAVLGGYRPWAYLGFALGTVYQYLLLKLAVTVIFSEMENVPEYHFDMPAMAVTFVSFAILYETIMHGYTKKMERLSIKEIMSE